MQILCPTSYLIISYYLTGQPLEPTRFSQVWLVCTLFTILAQSFGILTGIAFNTDVRRLYYPANGKFVNNTHFFSLVLGRRFYDPSLQHSNDIVCWIFPQARRDSRLFEIH